MAYCDYRHCDVCDRKVFYDANLAYDDGPPYYRTAGKPQDMPIMRLGNLGDWAVICDDCAKTHRCIVQTIEGPKP